MFLISPSPKGLVGGRENLFLNCVYQRHGNGSVRELVHFAERKLNFVLKQLLQQFKHAAIVNVCCVFIPIALFIVCAPCSSKHGRHCYSLSHVLINQLYFEKLPHTSKLHNSGDYVLLFVLFSSKQYLVSLCLLLNCFLSFPVKLAALEFPMNFIKVLALGSA